VLVAAAIVCQLTLEIWLAIAIAGGHQPHDFIAYDLAARHLLAGQPLYDTTATATGGLGLFLYPPSFALLMLPVVALPTTVAAPIWLVLLLVVAIAAVWLMPVSRVVRWGLTLMLGLSYPLVDALAQGQVGPLLLLLFALGWRAIDWRRNGRSVGAPEWPALLGVGLGLGATIKVQPAISIGWAILTRRWRAAAIAIGLAGTLAVVATVIVGPGAWADLARVLAQTNQPITTEHSVGIARATWELGVPGNLATGLYLASLVAAAAAVLAAIRWGTAVSSYLVTAVASQLLSPVVWAHYAIVLFLPVAWLLARRRWWAILVLVALSIPIAGSEPAIVYPIVFAIAILATLREGVLERRAAEVA
jgi:alpha-1,2-mannosyltransferase